MQPFIAEWQDQQLKQQLSGTQPKIAPVQNTPSAPTEAPQGKMTVDQFGQSIKAKYPQYQNIPDAEVGKRALEKYPVYADRVHVGSTEPSHPVIAKDTSVFEKTANAINSAYDTYKNAPIVKQASQAVGAALAVPSAAIGGAVSAIGTPIRNAIQGKPLTENLGNEIIGGAKNAGEFGYNIGKEGTPAAPLSAAGRAVNLALAYGQGYQGLKDVTEGIQKGDAAQSFQGAIGLGTSFLGARGALEAKTNLPDIQAGKDLVNKMRGKPSEVIAPSNTGAVEAYLSPDQTKALDKAEIIHRQVMNLGKSEAKAAQRAELNNGRIVNTPRLAAQEGLTYGRTEDGKIDTTEARRTVQERMDKADESLDKMLASDDSKWFNLEDLRSKMHRHIASLSNVLATDKKAMKNHIDGIINSEIDSNGEMLTGLQAQQLKRGLYKSGYPQGMTPERGADIRNTANIVKDGIENHYSDKHIKEVNQILGDYMALDKALENAHGRVVRGGLLGKAINRIGGAAIGTVAGSVLGPLGSGAGAIAGQEIAGRLTDRMLSPERLTNKAAKIVEKAGIKSRVETPLPPKPAKPSYPALPPGTTHFIEPTPIPNMPDTSGPITPEVVPFTEAQARMRKQMTGIDSVAGDFSLDGPDGSKIIRNSKGQHFITRPGYKPTRISIFEARNLEKAGYEIVKSN